MGEARLEFKQDRYILLLSDERTRPARPHGECVRVSSRPSPAETNAGTGGRHEKGENLNMANLIHNRPRHHPQKGVPPSGKWLDR